MPTVKMTPQIISICWISADCSWVLELRELKLWSGLTVSLVSMPQPPWRLERHTQGIPKVGLRG